MTNSKAIRHRGISFHSEKILKPGALCHFSPSLSSYTSTYRTIVLPPELIGWILTFMDGMSLLQCAQVSTVWEKMTHQRKVWKNICALKWPTLNQLLPQLPGAPDYDVRERY